MAPFFLKLAVNSLYSQPSLGYTLGNTARLVPPIPLSALLLVCHLPSCRCSQASCLVLLSWKLSRSLHLLPISKHFPTISQKALKHQTGDVKNTYFLIKIVPISVHLFPVLLSQFSSPTFSESSQSPSQLHSFQHLRVYASVSLLIIFNAHVRLPSVTGSTWGSLPHIHCQTNCSKMLFPSYQFPVKNI